jgi:hypothetical protein
VSGDLVLLTRDGCVNTVVMRAHVEAALSGLTLSVRVVHLETLDEGDVRRGYPTPTLLYAGRDVFGLPIPQPPLPAPT